MTKLTLATLTLNAWKAYAQAHSLTGCDNVFTVDGVSYSFDARPRQLANGALQGRCYAQGHGESPVDIGMYKIGATGLVLAVPAELAGILPDRFPQSPDGVPVAGVRLRLKSEDEDSATFERVNDSRPPEELV